MKVVKNDQVLVITGNEKGKQGRVLKTYPKTGRILVEGVKLIKRHTRPTSKSPQGGIVEKEAPINVSNVLVVCPKCNTPGRVKHKVIETGKSVRICRSCGEMITTSA